MAKIPVKQYWTSYDDDVARDWVDGNYSNVRQPTSARTIENLAHGVNHLQSRSPRPMFGASRGIATSDTTGADPLYQWAYEDSVYNGTTYRITVVGVPRTTTNVGNARAAQWDGSDLYDSSAAGTNSNAVALTAVNAYYDAFYEEFDVNRAAASNARVIDGVSTFNGYTALHVGVQELPLGWLDTVQHIYCDPTQAKKAGKVLADLPEAARSTFHDLRTTNLPIVLSFSSQGGVPINCLNASPANLFDTSIGARSAESPGAMYDAQYCARGDPGQRSQCNVKVYCAISGMLTSADASPMNVIFIGPLDHCNIVIADHDGGWHGNTDHFIYLDANAGGAWSNVGANKIDVMGCVNAAGDFFEWTDVRCWIDYE